MQADLEDVYFSHVFGSNATEKIVA